MNKSRKQINENIKLKKNNFDLEIDEEIKKTEKEIKSLKLSSIEHINKIAIETSSEIVEKIVGTKANSSRISAIVGDISKKRIGFNSKRSSEDNQEAINKIFSPEFRNRIDSIIPFNHLNENIVLSIVDKFMIEIEAQLDDKGVTLSIDK